MLWFLAGFLVGWLATLLLLKRGRLVVLALAYGMSEHRVRQKWPVVGRLVLAARRIVNAGS